MPCGMPRVFAREISTEDIMTEWKNNWRAYTVAVIAVCVLVLQIAAMYFAVVPAIAHRISFVCLTMILLFLQEGKNKFTTSINWLFILLCIVDMGYVFAEASRLEMRIAYVEDLEPMDYFMGITFIIMLLEGTRRIAGNVLFALARGLYHLRIFRTLSARHNRPHWIHPPQFSGIQRHDPWRRARHRHRRSGELRFFIFCSLPAFWKFQAADSFSLIRLSGWPAAFAAAPERPKSCPAHSWA